MDELLNILRPLLKNNPEPYMVADALQDLGFIQYPTHVFKGKGLVIKQGMFVNYTVNPPFPHVKTVPLSEQKTKIMVNAWVLQPVCEKVSLADYEEFADKYESLEIANAFDLHAGNVGRLNGEVLAFDW